MTNISVNQLSTLVNAHCYRVVDNMSADDLFNYAVGMMVDSFDRNPGQGDTDVNMLMTDIFTAEGGDEDAVFEFMVAAGVDGNTAEKLIGNTQV